MAQKRRERSLKDSTKKRKEVTMNSVDVRSETDAASGVEPVDMKLEVVVIGVSDVDRAKSFYENLGWRLDIDAAKGDDFRGVQMTPHNSESSIIFGKGSTTARPGAAGDLVLVVDDVDAAHAELVARGVD
ncbi:MAG: VOC family protein, partial [Gemmatimonadota bacterium]